MTQNELAAKLGYSRSLVAALEVNQRLPDVDSVVNSFIPVLGLAETPILASQLVELAAKARQERVPPSTQVGGLHRSQSTPDAVHSLNRIPVAPTPLIGRERELTLLCDRFLEQNTRLLTLVGPPGIGKTRLAQALANRLQGYFADGSRYVSLVDFVNPEYVVPGLMSELGISPGNGPSIARLVAHLRNKEVLLVLDNFEQLLLAAPILSQLLAECANLRMIVTSRERLHLRTEHVALVAPLALADGAELFMQRAMAASVEILPTIANQTLVEKICRHLDCVPLSIELCAVQADFYTLEQLLERVQTQHLNALSDEIADLPPHHRALRAAIQTSYNLLTPEERALFQMLSVFAGGCNPAIVEEVWKADPQFATVAVSDLLRALVAKNLVQVQTTDTSERRFSMLTSVSEFARERLQQEGDPQEVRARHCNAILRYFRDGDSQLRGTDVVVWGRRLDMEMDNLRAAVQYTFESGKYTEYAWLLLASQYQWQRRGLLTECAEMTERILPYCDRMDIETHLAVKTVYVYKRVSLHMRDKVKRIVGELGDLAEKCGDPLVKSSALRWTAQLASDDGVAIDAYTRAINYARTGRSRPEARAILGVIAEREVMLPKAILYYAEFLTARGERVESAQLTAESLVLYRSVGDIAGAAHCLGNLGRLALLDGDARRACDHFAEAVAIGEKIGDYDLLCHCQPYYGLALLRAGEILKSREHLARGLAICTEMGAPETLEFAYCFLAEADLLAGDVDSADKCMQASLSQNARPSSKTVFDAERSALSARIAQERTAVARAPQRSAPAMQAPSP